MRGVGAVLLVGVCTGACAAAGGVVEQSGEALGVGAVTSLAGVAYGFLSWPIWDFLFGALAEWWTGTEESRVRTIGPTSQAGDPARVAGSLEGEDMTGFIAGFFFCGLLGVVAIFWLMRHGSLLKSRFQQDDEWGKRVEKRLDDLELMDRKHDVDINVLKSVSDLQRKP